MSSPQEIAMRLLEGSAPSDDWQPPSDWLEVPEPEDYEINLLVNIYGIGTSYDAPNKIQLQIATKDGEFLSGQGPLSIDWGDGTIDSYAHNTWSQPAHSYTETGQYIIKITATEQSGFLQKITENRTLLIMKLGSRIIVNDGSTGSTQSAFYNHRALCWIKFNGTGGLPLDQEFENDAALKRIDMTVPPKIIPRSTFYNTNYGGKFNFSEVTVLEESALRGSAFKKLDLPKCTAMGESACNSIVTLEEITAPLCTSVGNYGFSNCGKLSKAEFAEECEYGSNCFSGCFGLTPRPDGSII